MISPERLARNWFFKGFSQTQIKALLGLAQQASYTAGEKVVVEGEPAESFHILVQGTISIKMRMEEHGEMVLSILKQAGEIFGWSALVEGAHSTATAECLEDTKVLSFGRKELESLFARDPVLGYCFMKRLAGLVSRRLESTRSLLVKQIS
jgi:CRP/FNR family cyclic AMP-dependent transcriptional regulator